MTDINVASYLYERLSTDKYGGWVAVFGREPLRGLCERISDEIEPVIAEELVEAEEALADLEHDFQVVLENMEKLGFDWNDMDKKFVITEDFKEAIRHLRI